MLAENGLFLMLCKCLMSGESPTQAAAHAPRGPSSHFSADMNGRPQTETGVHGWRLAGEVMKSSPDLWW